MTDQAVLDRLNALSDDEAHAEFFRCCGSSRWAGTMTGYLRCSMVTDRATLFTAAEYSWLNMNPDDWQEAFAHHPKIGDVESLRRKFATTAAWASGEQSGVAGADESILTALAEGNAAYEAKFGYIFIVCATGKSAEEMLALLNARLPNAPEDELPIAAEEQKKITRLRLEKLFLENAS